MNFSDICRNRYSVRNYEDTPIEKEKLNYVLETARLAPSAVNFQPWTFVVVMEDENREKVIEAYHRDWFKSAPCYIIMCADHSISWKRRVDNKDFADVDVAIATEHICLAATEQGLGTCWVCNFDPAVLRENFNIPEHMEPIAILSIGYPVDGTEVEKNRKPLSEIVKWEKF